MNERKLKDLLESDFAEGYEQFKEIIEKATNTQRNAFSDHEKASLRIYELLSVAAIQGLNETENTYELPPEVLLPIYWRCVGYVLATINAQAFEKPNNKILTQGMKKALLSGYAGFLNLAQQSNPAAQ